MSERQSPFIEAGNNLDFARATARPLETAYWEDKIEELNEARLQYQELASNPEHRGLDIDMVGPGKPLAYSTVKAIEASGRTIEDVTHSCEESGHSTFLSPDNDRRRGFFYVYDRTALQDLLDIFKNDLQAAGWPEDADEFVKRVSGPENAQGKMYELVGLAFNDHRWWKVLLSKDTKLSPGAEWQDVDMTQRTVNRILAKRQRKRILSKKKD